MMLGFCKWRVTAGTENIQGISPYGMLNQSNQPTQFGHFPYLDPPHQQWGLQPTKKIYPVYDGTDSSLVSIRFRSRVFRVYSIDGASGIYNMSSHIVFYFFALVFIHFVSLARFVAQICTSFSILVSRMRMLYHYFYCIFSGYLPPN
jgi:hypothetical protein